MFIGMEFRDKHLEDQALFGFGGQGRNTLGATSLRPLHGKEFLPEVSDDQFCFTWPEMSGIHWQKGSYDTGMK